MTPAAPEFLYGTAWKEDRTAALTELALRAGFRGIDTANQRRHYFEAAVGEGIAAASRAGIARRADLFIQTKFTYLPGQDHRLPYDPRADVETQVRQSFESSLEHLGTTYLDSYVLHTDGDRLRIETPLREKRIAAVHRGGGPRDVQVVKWGGLDGYLLGLAQERGARVAAARVTEVGWDDGRPQIRFKTTARSYDLVVGATGVNSASWPLFEQLGLRDPPYEIVTVAGTNSTSSPTPASRVWAASESMSMRVTGSCRDSQSSPPAGTRVFVRLRRSSRRAPSSRSSRCSTDAVARRSRSPARYEHETRRGESSLDGRRQRTHIDECIAAGRLDRSVPSHALQEGLLGRIAQALRRAYRQPQAGRRLLYGRWFRLHATPGRPGRLGVDGDDLVAAPGQRPQARHRERSRAHEDQTQALSARRCHPIAARIEVGSPYG